MSVGCVAPSVGGWRKLKSKLSSGECWGSIYKVLKIYFDELRLKNEDIFILYKIFFKGLWQRTHWICFFLNYYYYLNLDWTLFDIFLNLNYQSLFESNSMCCIFIFVYINIYYYYYLLLHNAHSICMFFFVFFSLHLLLTHSCVSFYFYIYVIIIIIILKRINAQLVLLNRFRLFFVFVLCFMSRRNTGDARC